MNKKLPCSKDFFVLKILKLLENEGINKYTAKELIKRAAKDDRMEWGNEEEGIEPLEKILSAQDVINLLNK